MNTKVISDYLTLSPRFLHSVDLIRDFKDPRALSDYCLTDFAASCLVRIAEGIHNGSGRRAWRLTGDYGSGKSAFALLLASALAGERNRLPNGLFRKISQSAPDLLKANYTPLLVVGSRQPMGRAVLEKLPRIVAQKLSGRVAAGLLRQINAALKNPSLSDEKVVELLALVSSHLVKVNRRGGLLIILDEVGKFLEYAALNSHSHDIFFLQKLAEAASRSGDTPLLLVCLLHQGFSAYADQLAQSSQREWEKVAGRLEEIAYNHPLDQMFLLFESALSVKVADVPSVCRTQAIRAMEMALELGWFGAVSNKRILINHAPGIFPIDPFVLPVLLRTFQRFGQNERSLFSFIYSFEPFGLRSFSSRPVSGAEPYRLYDFYDYVRSNFGHRLAIVSYRSRWSVIESIVEGFSTDNPIELRVLKTTGILNLLNTDELLPTEERLIWAVAGNDDHARQDVARTISKLRHRGVLHYRGAGRGYCLWPYTSVDIEKAFDEAKRQVPSVQSIPLAITNLLDTRPLVARRHYIETGNLRYFNITYCAVNDLVSVVNSPDAQADGRIVITLCENDLECRQAREIALGFTSGLLRPILIAVTQPLERLRAFILEAQRWESVISNTPELNADPYAREEVIRYRTYAQQALRDAIQDYVGLTRFSAQTSLSWFYKDQELNISAGRDVLAFLSNLCTEVYNQAPILKNELVNRHKLSSAAAAARMRLIAAMFTKPDVPFLGMPQERKPPEMSMYLSVLKAPGLHRIIKGKWRLSEPSQTDHHRFKPSLKRIWRTVESRPDSRVSIQSLFSELRNPPLGLREGIIPILIAIILIAHEQELALYENGTFLREVGKEAFLRMTKAPENFEIQYCKIEGIRSEVFNKLANILGLQKARRQNPDLLEVVKKLCLFVAQLPEYSRNTKRLPEKSQAVREAILHAREPVRLVFYDLPIACALEEIHPKTQVNSAIVEQLVESVKKALSDLRSAHPGLQERMRAAIAHCFGMDAANFSDIRLDIADRAERLLVDITEPRLKAFCFRLADRSLPENEWLESIGSYIALRPPSKWRDEDEELFDRDLSRLVLRFKHAESTLFSRYQKAAANSLVRLSITKATGHERQEVFALSPDEVEKARRLESTIMEIISKNGRVALAALLQALWEYLPKAEEMGND